MINTVIYGGSFDPVHKGHEAIIDNLAARFDSVIVVPTFVSPFKQGEKAAPAELRLAMLASCKFPGNVTVSDYEINKADGCSYSIDTVRHFTRDGVKLFFAIGSEGAQSVDRWREAEALKKLCTFYIIKRPGFDKRTLDKRFVYADFEGEDISSSEVKVALALDKADGLIGDGVKKIIKANNLYDDYTVYTKEYAKFGLKPERIEHTYRATVTGIKLAKRYGVSVRDTTAALLLHDIGKYVTPEFLSENNIPVPYCGGLPAPCLHAEYGAAICKYYFGLDDRIVEAVRTHTTCAPRMDKLAEIVALADYIEPGRKFAGVEKIRRAASEDLSLAVEMMLKNTLNYLHSTNKYIAPITELAYKEYQKKKEILWKSKK